MKKTNRLIVAHYPYQKPTRLDRVCILQFGSKQSNHYVYVSGGNSYFDSLKDDHNYIKIMVSDLSLIARNGKHHYYTANFAGVA